MSNAKAMKVMTVSYQELVDGMEEVRELIKGYQDVSFGNTVRSLAGAVEPPQEKEQP